MGLADRCDRARFASLLRRACSTTGPRCGIPGQASVDDASIHLAIAKHIALTASTA